MKSLKEIFGLKNMAQSHLEKPEKMPNKAQENIIIQLHQEFKDHTRKDINKWRFAIQAATGTDDPRWFQLQDIIDELLFDAHLSSVIEIRKTSTLNNDFYIIDKAKSQINDELTDIINKSWFYDFLNYCLDSIFRRVSLIEIIFDGKNISCEQIPFRNICPQLKRVYLEVNGDKYIDYSKLVNVIEVLSKQELGLINDIIPNIIWKRNALQSYAEFTERFGMPLISATVSSVQDAQKAEKGLKNMGENASAVFPQGANIQVHSLANAGNPESTYVASAVFHDNQISKRIIGSTTLTDEGANRAQTEVHLGLLDYKIAIADKRMISFFINDKLFPILQSYGLGFDNTKYQFIFDETEDLTLTQEWNIVRDAALYYQMDEDELRKRFNLPIIGEKNPLNLPQDGLSANFQ
jgi:hypothetical protein